MRMQRIRKVNHQKDLLKNLQRMHRKRMHNLIRRKQKKSRTILQILRMRLMIYRIS